MAATLSRLLLLITLAFISGAMFLFPKQQAFEQERIFMHWWWSQHSDSLDISNMDSVEIQALPISDAAKKTMEFRRKRSWPFKNMDELTNAPGIHGDSLWWSMGFFKFTKDEKKNKEYYNVYAPVASTQHTYQQNPNWGTTLSEEIRAEPVDLSIADSTSLVAIKGVGGWTAKEILKYRDSYRYIASISHLKESTYLGQIWREEWDSIFIPSQDSIQLSLNSSLFQELLDFPEFNYKQTKRIAFYRENFGPLTWSELSVWEEFKGIDTNFLKLYVSE